MMHRSAGVRRAKLTTEEVEKYSAVNRQHIGFIVGIDFPAFESGNSHAIRTIRLAMSTHHDHPVHVTGTGDFARGSVEMTFVWKQVPRAGNEGMMHCTSTPSVHSARGNRQLLRWKYRRQESPAHQISFAVQQKRQR